MIEPPESQPEVTTSDVLLASQEELRRLEELLDRV
jgi:hypothetical protein